MTDTQVRPPQRRPRRTLTDNVRGEERARILNDLDTWVRWNPNATAKMCLAYLRGELR